MAENNACLAQEIVGVEQGTAQVPSAAGSHRRSLLHHRKTRASALIGNIAAPRPRKCDSLFGPRVGIPLCDETDFTALPSMPFCPPEVQSHGRTVSIDATNAPSYRIGFSFIQNSSPPLNEWEGNCSSHLGPSTLSTSM